jgi:hypothetical protein
MKMFPCIGILLSFGAIALAQPPPDKDIVLKAMKDEMDRTKQLRIIGDPPYFVEYTLDDNDLYTVSASYGALMHDNNTHFRHPRVRIRVGDPKLDNSNHIASDFYRGTRYDSSQMALEDNYDSLRLGFWLSTDRMYKQALEALARKRASLKNINVSGDLLDFSPAPVVSLFPPIQPKPVNADMWRSRVREVSSLFGNYPQILNSDASVSITQSTSYLVNNEGTEFRIPDDLATFQMRATGLAPDGMVVRDYEQFLGIEASSLPDTAAMKAAAARVAENIDLLAKATVIDSYSGPMLFEGMAGPQLMAQLLARNLVITRKPVSDPDRPINMPAQELEGRIGSRIMPDWMDVVDDPTQKEWRGKLLAGSYIVDGEGVVPKPLPLVEKGVLKTYYASRQPLVGVKESNGHARLPGNLGNNVPLAGNVFIRSSQPVSAADLKKKFLDMLKQRNLAFGIIVRKLDFPSTASIDELRRFAGSQQTRPVSRPILVYKVTPDGKEELLRGVRFRNLSARSMKDIQAASDDSFVFQYLENQGPFAHMDAGGYVAPTSVIGPSLLVDDVELEKIPGELPKPPLVPPPALTQ